MVTGQSALWNSNCRKLVNDAYHHLDIPHRARADCAGFGAVQRTGACRQRRGGHHRLARWRAGAGAHRLCQCADGAAQDLFHPKPSAHRHGFSGRGQRHGHGASRAGAGLGGLGFGGPVGRTQPRGAEPAPAGQLPHGLAGQIPLDHLGAFGGGRDVCGAPAAAQQCPNRRSTCGRAIKQYRISALQ